MTLVPFPPPYPTAQSLKYWEGLSAGQIQIPWCNDCAAYFLYPRSICPNCWSNDWEWRQPSRLGRVQAATEVHKPQHPAFASEVPYTIAVVRLDVGPQLIAIVAGDGSWRPRVGTRAILTTLDRDAFAVPAIIAAPEDGG